MSSGLSDLKSLWQVKQVDGAVQLAKNAYYVNAANAFDDSDLQPEQQVKHGNDLAYAFYRRALIFQRDLDGLRAIMDLETALRFPGAAPRLRRLFQQRLTAIQKGAIAEVQKFDTEVSKRFEGPPSAINLRTKFLTKFGLQQAKRHPIADGIDEVSAIGVYRWSGDEKRHEQWSRLIRRFKQGDPALPGFFGRVLAEHVQANQRCQAWLREVDYIVPVPSAENRTAKRGLDILAKTGDHMSSRLGIPLRTDFLKRADSSLRSRFIGKSELTHQYQFADRRADEVRERTILLLDDVMNRGYTVGACALRLREAGCKRVLALVLALAESSLQSSRLALGTEN